MENHKILKLSADLQIAFFLRLTETRKTYFGEALSQTVKEIDISELDKELARLIPAGDLKKLASYGLRGEVLFPTPIILKSNPHLLGYYRFLFGFSQKEFYQKSFYSKFRSLETRGRIPAILESSIEPLCKDLIYISSQLLGGISYWTLDTVKELQILTLGPQLRGGQNTFLGQDATRIFYSLVSDIVSKNLIDKSERVLKVQNDSSRIVLIEFFSDPDVRITELVGPEFTRKIVSIEIKGGSDYSNIHNRLGEAEKSHQNAKKNGFFEFWTVTRVELELSKAKEESPTTSHFYFLDKITDKSSVEYKDFQQHLCSIIGIRIS